MDKKYEVLLIILFLVFLFLVMMIVKKKMNSQMIGTFTIMGLNVNAFRALTYRTSPRPMVAISS